MEKFLFLVYESKRKIKAKLNNTEETIKISISSNK